MCMHHEANKVVNVKKTTANCYNKVCSFLCEYICCFLPSCPLSPVQNMKWVFPPVRRGEARGTCTNVVMYGAHIVVVATSEAKGFIVTTPTETASILEN